MPLINARFGPGLSPMLSIYSREGALSQSIGSIAAPVSAVSPQTQTAFYYPVVLPVMGTAHKFWWLNGATASTNNVQVGVFADTGAYKPGAAIKLGTSTLAVNANVVQFDDIADTQMGPGLVWLAVWIGGTTTTLMRNNSFLNRMTRTYQEAGLTGGLPSTATPAAPGGAFAAPFWLFGVQFRASP